MSEPDNSYVVVARRYRPRGFDELVGQDHVGRALKNAIETNRVGHAYLFTGARGVGKTSTARIFAKALNDPGGPTASPNNASDVALAIDSGEDVDVIEIDGASNRGIDEIRSLRANVGVRPSRSRYKIYIIDEVHMLTGAAFNALLKTLEEPPEHVKFIFCTTDPEKIPITVLSRCQRFDFAPVEVTKIVKRLKEIVEAENAQADEAALELIARRAAGSMRDSQSLLEQVLSFCDSNLTADQVHAMLGTADDERLHALAKAMADRDAASAIEQLDAGIDAGVDAGRLAEQLLGYFRDLMAVSVGCDPSLMRHTSASLHDELKELGDRWGLQTVLAVVGLIDQTLVRIRHSVYARVLLEATVIQICNLPDLQNIANLAAAASDLGGAVGNAKPPAAAGSTSSGPASEKKNVAEPAVQAAKPELVASPETSQVAPSVPAETTGNATSQTNAANKNGATASPSPAPVASSTVPANPPSESPEPSGKAAGEVSSIALQALTAASVGDLWNQAAEQVETSTATLARANERVELANENTVRLVFAAESKLSVRRFDSAEHKSAMIAALRTLVGREVNVECTVAAPVKREAKQTTKPSSKDRMQRMRDIELHPMVKACAEIFGAEVVKVDHPR
ncbi:DNA polymerase III subunit gamma/tau [Planctomycetes bacterium K23_9]|uniref:DNA polymerase III subunit gamma/tau n=1 Tax=Stieleria marina TaxID=1930275 RepID=A0A517P0A3_9BACT|nr:DNA polymerase III subunit tau [Planctomycetes bacterium K23_9]